MIAIRSYPTALDAELARLRLAWADIPTTVSGIDLGMQGGTTGVQLWVPEAFAEAARAVLDAPEE
ncbi:hypothetical protein RKE25_12635 [Dyella sp. BiH032]|uniref:hypothetical protein n=1 Tax=Dyella sp. BiH032 TaxID=3075430 RepID=UPI002893385D|nr:hypothetical protein [Dyella sp. BiH032]WNL44275.1 hypothetical protein RKE25_12635 [Dyella sp. BiH032]